MSALLQLALGRRARRRHASRDGGLPAGFRAAGVAAGSSRAARSTSACSSSDAPETTSAARFTRSGVLAAPVLLSPRALRPATRCARSSSTPATRTPPPAARGLESAAKMQGAAAMALGVEADAGRGRLDRRDRRAAADRARSSRRARARGARAAPPTATPTSRAAILTTDAFEKRAALDVELPAGTVRLTAQAKGAGMISPRFATMLCFVQTDAALSRRDARPAARRDGQALVRPHLRRRPALDQRHRDPAWRAAQRRRRSRPSREDELRFGEALDALLRQLALLIVARRRGRAADRARRRARRRRRDRRARAPARSRTRRW